MQISSFSYKKNHKVLETLGQHSCKATISWGQVEAALFTQEHSDYKRQSPSLNQGVPSLWGRGCVCTPKRKKRRMEDGATVLPCVPQPLHSPQVPQFEKIKAPRLWKVPFLLSPIQPQPMRVQCP